MKKKQVGYCHICGKYGELSFEHIPPETALNKNRAIVYTGNDVIKRYKGEKSRYINQQQGMGKYTLCENCNASKEIRENVNFAYEANEHGIENVVLKNIEFSVLLRYGLHLVSENEWPQHLKDQKPCPCNCC